MLVWATDFAFYCPARDPDFIVGITTCHCCRAYDSLYSLTCNIHNILPLRLARRGTLNCRHRQVTGQGKALGQVLAGAAPAPKPSQQQ